MNRSLFTNKLKEKALATGFDKVGVVASGELADEREHLEVWLQEGFHGEMQWMEREPLKRTDPGLMFEGAKSVVSLAVNYYTPHEHSSDARTGKISRYAWGDDYHDVVREKLNTMIEWIGTEQPEAKARGFVDTAPIMDKAWAVRAGLGWLGKHTNVITPEYGSWVFLAEILLDIELDYDGKVIEDHCGSCTACIDACPTDAIREPYLVDSNRCISYATIELRSTELPQRFDDNLDGWLYGCDICQDVCPWNRFQQPTPESRFEPRPHNVAPLLEDIVTMPHEEYVEKFRKSAVKRTKLSGLHRNAAALERERKAKDCAEKINENDL